jgi:hypothetical protein
VTVVPPSDYRLFVPDGWFRIALDPALWEKRIHAFVERRFRGVDNAPHIKQQVRDQLCEQAVTAYANGGTELYLSMLAAAGIPIAAGLVVSYSPPPDGGEHPPLERVVGSLTDGVAEVVTLPAGKAVRHYYQRQPRPEDPAMAGLTLPVTHLDFQVPVPGTPGRLMLSFSTPVAPLVKALIALFDQIARTLKWVP